MRCVTGVALLATGCSGGDDRTPRRATEATPAKSRIIDIAAAQTDLDTPRATIVERYGTPLKSFAQPVPGKPALDCSVYRSNAEDTYVRFCFTDGKLSVVGTVFGAAALKPSTPPAKGGKTRQLTPNREKAGGGLRNDS